MPSTLFEYLYRDAGNYKAFGSVVLAGALSPEELEQVRARFPGDGHFIAEQIGIPALYAQLYQWSDGPTASDHCWHEFIGANVVEDHDAPPEAVRSGTAQQFLTTLRSVEGW